MLQVPGLEIGHQSKCDGREDLKENSVVVFVVSTGWSTAMEGVFNTSVRVSKRDWTECVKDTLGSHLCQIQAQAIWSICESWFWIFHHSCAI